MRIAAQSECTVLDALRRLIPGASHRTLRQILEQRRVRVNGDECRLAHRRLVPGDSVEVTERRPRPPSFKGLEVVYEDESLLVAHKPAGLLTVATPHEHEQTACAILRGYLRRARRSSRLYVVHRIDKFVSGLLVFAKSQQAQANLKSLFEKHEIERKYWAIVQGRVEQGHGSIRTRLVQDRNLRMRSTKSTEGKPAVTHYRVLRRLRDLSVLEITLETGRKNQIRAHLSELGHPVAGDRAYGSTTDPLKRMGLHAFCLGFVHPSTGTQLRFETPPPPEFVPYLAPRTVP